MCALLYLFGCFQELELLPAKELQTNVYIKHPVSMEQYLMEGSYNKVRSFSIVYAAVCWEKNKWLLEL